MQLYPLLKELAVDFDATLARVAGIGIRRVEVPSFVLSGRTWTAVRQALDKQGLVCPSVHFGMTELLKDPEMSIAAAQAVGARFVVCAAPWIRDVSRVRMSDLTNPLARFLAVIAALDLDDWRWNAGELNRIGEAVKSAGFQLAYHSHNFDFKRFGDVVAYDELLRLTDADLVKLELDCGWVAVAGLDPVRYVREHPDRFALLHARDYEPGFTPTTELTVRMIQLPEPARPAIIGHGIVDYPALIAAARRAGTLECFIEREPFAEMPILDAIEQDYRSLSGLVQADERIGG